MPASLEEIWNKGALLAGAFAECRLCLADFHSRSRQLLQTAPDIPVEFRILPVPPPPDAFLLRKNLFSTLFQSIYALLNVHRDRRLLYGKLNYLFRTWVTSADNLLDNEDKVVLPMRLPGESRVMRQVIAIMAADRIMKQLLDEAVERNVLNALESRILSDCSLQILLPSAAEEASEEGGIAARPDPEYVLFTIHKLKTGLLFHIPFLGPETIESAVAVNRMRECKEGLTRFGLGCQLLDDIRDMAKDHLEKRHNYLLSMIVRHDPQNARLRELEGTMKTGDNICGYFPETALPAARRAFELLKEGLCRLDRAGLGLGDKSAETLALSMFGILDLKELEECVYEAGRA